ncbi:MAG: CoB--CoM heterodisulfide reductase iron-sulfur subunit A family protein [Chloroflexota bacterium]
MRTGVYVCHCGRNIAGTVDVAGVAEFAKSLPGVAIARDYRYVCSDPGQELIRDDIEDYGLDRVIIAACSLTMHQTAFMNNVEKAGLNPYRLERANIREQCSWVHADMKDGTVKAKALLMAALAKASLAQPLVSGEVPVTPAALVIGGGIAGVQAALDLGDAGFKVFLVEKENALGGHMAQLNLTFPGMDSAGRMVLSRLERVKNQSNIEVLTSSEVVEVEGYIGNFKVRVRRAGGEETELEVGAIVVATGYEVFDARLKPEFGYGVYPEVITTLDLERLSREDGPTRGRIEINGREPKNVVFIQCVGSRDKSVGVEYCSRVCCMTAAKQALYIKDKIPDAKITVCYIDVRTFGKGHEEFYETVQGRGVFYRRGTVSEVYRKGDRLVVRAEDTLLGEMYEEEADLVVLAVGIRPAVGASGLAKTLRISTGSDGFFLEAHPKLGPVETTTDGIVLAGCCVGPKDITDAVSEGHAAAVKVSVPLFLGRVKKEPLVAQIDEEVCAGCRLCENACEYAALVFDERRQVMTVNDALCRGCGACSAICPSGANQVKNTTKKQIFVMLAELV